MYTVQRKSAIKEDLEIQNAKGNVELTLHVNLFVDNVLSQYNRLRRMLGEAQYELSKDPTSEKTLSTYGATIVALFELIFGAEGVQKLLDYYDNRYTELLEDIAPFVVDVIQPQIDSAMKARASKYKELIKR